MAASPPGPAGAGGAGGAGGPRASCGVCLEPPGGRGGGEAPAACGVCLEPLEGHGELARGACAHWFHRGCLEQWAKVDTSCPLCKARFEKLHLSSGVEVPVEDRRQVWEDEGGYSNWDFLVCSECGGGDESALLLICDGCEGAAHTFCVGLGREVPEGDWFCPRCTGSMPVTERRERLWAMQRRRGEQAQASGAARGERVQQREVAREERLQRELLETIVERRQQAQERTEAQAGTLAGAPAGARDFRRPGAARQRNLVERRAPPESARRRRLRRVGEEMREAMPPRMYSTVARLGVSHRGQRRAEDSPKREEAEDIVGPSGGSRGRSIGRLTLAERRRALGKTRVEENPWKAFGLPPQDASPSGRGATGLLRGAAQPLRPSRPPRSAERPSGSSRPSRCVSHAARRSPTPTPDEAAFGRKERAPRGPVGPAAASTRPILDTDTLGTRRKTSVYFDPPRGSLERPAPPVPEVREGAAAKPALAPPVAAAAAGGSSRGMLPSSSSAELNDEERKRLKGALAAGVKKLLYGPLRSSEISNQQFKETAKKCTRRAYKLLMEEAGSHSGAAAIRKLLQAADTGPPPGAPLTPRCWDAIRPEIEELLGKEAAAAPRPSDALARQPAKKSKYF